MNYQPSYQDFLYTDYIPSYSDSLAHHGIKGMHWGVRRYQNTDGSYTPEGKKHRGSSSTNSNKNSTKRKGLSENAKTRLKIAGTTLGGAAAIAGASYLASKYVGDPNAHVDYTNNAGKTETETKNKKTPKATRIPKDYWQQKKKADNTRTKSNSTRVNSTKLLTNESESTAKARNYRNKVKKDAETRKWTKHFDDRTMREYAEYNSRKRLPEKRGVGYNDVEEARSNLRKNKGWTQTTQETINDDNKHGWRSTDVYYKRYAKDTRAARENYRNTKKKYNRRVKNNS